MIMSKNDVIDLLVKKDGWMLSVVLEALDSCDKYGYGNIESGYNTVTIRFNNNIYSVYTDYLII